MRGDVSLRFGTYDDVNLFRSEIGGTTGLQQRPFDRRRSDSRGRSNDPWRRAFHQGFTTAGMIDLRLAHIGQSLSFNHAIFTGKGANGLNAERATVGGTLYWVA